MTDTTSSSRDAPAQGSSIAEKVKIEAKEKAKEGARAIESRAESMATIGMAKAEEHLRGLGHALEVTRSELEQESHPLAGAFGSAHDRVDRIARGLADRDPAELVGDAESFARRNPWLFIGGCFVGGVALGRFLKASDPEPQTARPALRAAGKSEETPRWGDDTPANVTRFTGGSVTGLVRDDARGEGS